MAINNYFDNTDINIYFHMKNHYKKLRSARSTIDNSLPQGFVKTFSTPPNSGRSFRSNYIERDIKNDPHLPIHSSIVKKHNCITTSASGTSINPLNLQPKPKSKRKPSPFKIQYIPPRPQSTHSTRRSTCTASNKVKRRQIEDKKCNIGDNKSELTLNKIDSSIINNQFKIEEIDKTDTNRSLTPKESEEKCNKQPRVEEHEYLQFLLRITEDIIINNLYSNEDIEKVFQTHIEANKNHLKVEKMEAQLARLCIELEIPFKDNENDSRKTECYEYFFDPSSSDQNQNLEDCECTTKRKLNIAAKENIVDSKNEQQEKTTEFCLQKLFNILANEYGQGIVKESAEPSNSIDALIVESMKQRLDTTIQNNSGILSCLKNLKIGDEQSNETLCHNMFFDKEDTVLCNDSNLTEKEKLGCMEEDILFEKLNSNLINQVEDTYINESENANTKDDIIINKNNKNTKSDMPVINIATENLITQSKEKLNTYLDITDNNLNIFVENSSIISPKNEEKNELDCSSCHKLQNTELCGDSSNLICNKIQVSCVTSDILPIKDTVQNKKEATLKIKDQSCCNVDNTEQIKILKCSGNQTDPVTNDILLMKDNIENSKKISLNISQASAENIPKITTNDQFTQIEVTHSDKECNTSLILNDYHKNDYILLNGPIYVLKTVLNSKEKFVIYDKDNSGKNFGKEVDQKLCDEKVESIHYDTNSVLQTRTKLDHVPSYIQGDFSKLLSSDYDLMPQRDSDTSNKYNHLLVSAATSFSNIDLNERVNTFINPNALLLSDKYELTGQLHKEENNIIPETDNLGRYSLPKTNDFSLENRLYVGNTYGLKSFSSKDISGSVSNHAGKPFHEQMPELNTSATSYQPFSMNIIKEIDGKDLSESGEIVRASICTDDELSEVSTYRSENERSCNNLSPSGSNILNKQKFKHSA